MLLNLVELKELVALMDEARKGEGCDKPYIQDGLNYRWVPKPGANEARLHRAGHVTNVIDNVIHVKVPLGKHGRDHLSIDPATKQIVCKECHNGS